MPGRSNRPPPAGRRRSRWWRSGGASSTSPTAGHPTNGGVYESSAAAEQERLITQALENLRDMDVREVMTPRVDVVALTIPVHPEDVAQAVRESGHSCFPVVNGGLDDVVGVLYVNDLFRSRRSNRASLLTETGEEATAGGGESPAVENRPTSADQPASREPAGLSPIDISRRIRQPFVIPESRRILSALVEMRHHRRGFAVVVDEYGGVAGVLTVKDLLEPIVGDLRDELDSVDDEPTIVRVDGSRWLVDGRVNVDDVRERLGIDVPEGEYVTLGGYLFDGFGHIPVDGESLDIDGWQLTVQEMDRRRIAKVVARRHEPGDGDEADTSGETDEADDAQQPEHRRLDALTTPPASRRPLPRPADDDDPGHPAPSGATPGLG